MGCGFIKSPQYDRPQLELFLKSGHYKSIINTEIRYQKPTSISTLDSRECVCIRKYSDLKWTNKSDFRKSTFATWPSFPINGQPRKWIDVVLEGKFLLLFAKSEWNVTKQSKWPLLIWNATFPLEGRIKAEKGHRPREGNNYLFLPSFWNEPSFKGGTISQFEGR